VVPRHVGVALSLLEPGSLLTGLALSPIAGLADRGAYSAGIEKALVLWLVARALLAQASPGTVEPVAPRPRGRRRLTTA
jgi:hypothetical protein